MNNPKTFHDNHLNTNSYYQADWALNFNLSLWLFI